MNYEIDTAKAVRVSRRPMSGMDFATLKAKWDAAPCEWRIASAVGAFWLVRKLLA